MSGGGGPQRCNGAASTAPASGDRMLIRLAGARLSQGVIGDEMAKAPPLRPVNRALPIDVRDFAAL